MPDKKQSSILKVSVDRATFHGEGFEPTMVNFFFGRNGAGKSTVADILKNHPEDIEWENEDHDSREVLLYDQKFVTDHFRNREKDKKKIKGVFLVDKANAVKEDELEAKEAEQNVAQDNLDKASADNEANEKAKAALYPQLTEDCNKDTEVFQIGRAHV